MNPVFIYSYDKGFSRDLKSKGFKLINSSGNYDIFEFNKDISFDFSKFNKYRFSNKIRV